MAKRVDCSLLVHRAHNLLKGVAEAYEYYTIKMYFYTFLNHRRGIVKCPRQVSANLPRLDHSRNHRCILTHLIKKQTAVTISKRGLLYKKADSCYYK
jgi:hypothetical protein